MLYHDCVFAHVSCHIKRYVLSIIFKYALHPVHRSPTYIIVLFFMHSIVSFCHYIQRLVRARLHGKR